LSAVRLIEELRAMGYTGSVRTVRRFVARLDLQRHAGKRRTVRFDTPQGKQAQADWPYCGRFPDASGTMVPVYAFVMVLAWSRMMYVEFTTSMRLPVLIRCHLSAFRFLGGWPLGILYDNMKQVRLDADRLALCCLGRNVTDQPPCYAHGKENRHVEEANPTSFHV
jgi:transposase